MATLLGPLSTICVLLFLVSVMLSMGLEVTVPQLMATLLDRRLLLKALIANFVLVPMLGFLIVRISHLPLNVEEGLLLLSAAPGALFAVNFTRQMKDSIPLAAALLFLLAILSLIITPPLAAAMLRAEQPVTLDYGRAIHLVVEYVALPLVGGLALRRWFPPVAALLCKPISICAAVTFIAVVVLTMTQKSAATKQIGANGLIAMCLLIAGSMVIGWLTGGPQPGNRRVFAVSTSMRNSALCLAIALKSFPGRGVDVTVIAFSALMLPPNMIFTLYHGWKTKRAVSREND